MSYQSGSDMLLAEKDDRIRELRDQLDRKENLLERIRVKAMQTDWMENLTECLADELAGKSFA